MLSRIKMISVKKIILVFCAVLMSSLLYAGASSGGSQCANNEKPYGCWKVEGFDLEICFDPEDCTFVETEASTGEVLVTGTYHYISCLVSGWALVDDKSGEFSYHVTFPDVHGDRGELVNTDTGESWGLVPSGV